MSYPWQQAVWPIPVGSEITSQHFEDLRRFVFIKRFKDATTYNYSAPLTEATWEAWVDAEFADGDFVSPGLSYETANFSKLFNVVFQGNGCAADLYSCYTKTQFSRITLKNNPPVKNGVFNEPYWAIAADPNRYRDWDYNSGRRIITRYTAGTGIVYLSDAMAWRYLPGMCQPQDQLPLIKYDDTGRKIPDLKCQGLELNWQYLTQPSSLGPNFEIIGLFDESNDYYPAVVPWSGYTGYLSTAGWQYALPDGEPGQEWQHPNMPPDTLEQLWYADNQMKFDPKFCMAYQNQVEQVISYGWEMQIVPGTPWGDEYIANWDAYYGEEYTWERYGSWWASMVDPFWGCNSSAVELALWVIGEYDWWWDTDYPYIDPYILEQRSKDEHNGMGLDDLNAKWPLPIGTWRRTHKYTFGRPKDATIMLDGSQTPTGYTYADYSTESVVWRGIFVPAQHSPTADLLSDEGKTRHDAASDAFGKNRVHEIDYAWPCYEGTRQMLNDLWALLSVSSMAFVPWGVSFVYYYYYSDAHTNFGSAPLIYDAITADVMAKFLADAGSYSAYSTPPLGKIVSATYTAATGKWNSAATAGVAEAVRVKLSPDGDENLIEHLKSELIWARIIVKPYLYSDANEDANHNDPLTNQPLLMTLGNYSTLVPTFNRTYWDSPRPSTGVNDPIPDEFWDWGGYDTGASYNIIGKEIFVPLDLSKAIQVGDDFYYPVIWTPPEPAMRNYASPTNGLTAVAQGRCDLAMSSYRPGIGYDISPDVELDMTERHIAYTHVAVDDEKFDDDGYLINE